MTSSQHITEHKVYYNGEKKVSSLSFIYFQNVLNVSQTVELLHYFFMVLKLQIIVFP